MSTLLPSANSPQLLTRLLETVARGIRTVRGLQEALGVQAQTVRNYLQAARWLDLAQPAEPSGLVRLSPLGLSYVYAGSRRQAIYVQAVWSNPMAADLLTAGDGRLPTVAQVQRAVVARGNPLASATVHRRASAIRGLIAPAVGRVRPSPPEQDALQLALPLGHAAAVETGPPPPAPAADGDDPDVYRFVWAHLLDHGELSLGHLRALLARAGASGVSPSGAVLRAQARGDAALYGDRLVATAASIARRDLASSTSSVILSDPGYRAYLRYLVAAGEVPSASQAGPWAAWDRWLFGRAAEPRTVEADLGALLLERHLEAFPVARGDALAPPVAADPFLATWSLPGLPICLPPTLAQLLGGPHAVGRLHPDGFPTVLDPSVVFHGGLLHPLESPPAELGGAAGLRQRALRRTPAITLLASLLLLHRERPNRFALVHTRAGWGTQVGVASPKPLLAVVEAFAEARRWVLVRRPGGGLDAETLVRVGVALGVASVVGRQVVLAEQLAVELAADTELAEALHALADAWAAFVDRREAP